ncbi:hypothetical protein [Microbacterium oxydans]|uniref:hypothetical protein n=1 Tax=Microbacterium oxydans TaxID=82380 RepID=UPI00366B2E4C
MAEKKYELYLPFLKTLGDMLTPSRSAAGQSQLEDALADFQTYVTTWGSDEVVEAFYRYRVSAASEPPAMVNFRLMSDFLLEVRRDIAWPDTKLTGLHVIGMRINDLADHPELAHALTVPLDQLFKEQEWTPPFELPGLARES